MKKILTLVFLFLATHLFSQTDKKGNPVFNSVSINEEVIGDVKLIYNYYTLQNNIENKNSSVYISEHPSLEQIIRAATALPSDFFIIVKGQTVLSMVMMSNTNERKFIVLDPATGNQKLFNCTVKGDITENRANEIIKMKYDSAALIKDNKLFYNHSQFEVISNKDIRQAFLDLIKKENLDKAAASKMKILSKEELKTLVLAETKEGGKLDFFTPIKGHEYDAVQVQPAVFSTKLGVALYKWGKANFDLGVNTVDDALAIFAAFKGRPLNEREKDYIKLGFEKGFEK